MTAEQAFFLLFAFGALLGAGGVIAAKNPVNSAVSLVASFFCLAGVYVLLNAQFLAVLQILVYAGAIMVLFLFVLMLLNLREGEGGKPQLSATKLVGVVMALGVGFVIASSALGSIEGSRTLVSSTIPEAYGQVAPIGMALMTRNVLAFELVGVLLLVGIVGAVVVAKRRL
jgi:NADH-quinone oxidoreductase subunit J